MKFSVQHACDDDRADWLHMRTLLWPGDSKEHAAEIDAWYAGKAQERQAVVIARSGCEAAGFAEVSIRPYAEKCTTENVAYLEGWFVVATYRRLGAGRKLVEAAKDWGRSQGCREFASDAEPGNRVSIAAHKACGFEDAGLIRCFRQRI